MSELQTIPTSVSALMGMRVVDAAGKALGRVHEFAVDPAHDEAHVVALVLKHRAGGKTRNTLLPVAEISMPKAGQSGLRAKITPKPIKKLNDYLLLERDLLDQQIIDVDGRKVVRVNDVMLAWEPGAAPDATAGLLIQRVEVGTRGAVRRLLKGVPAGAVESICGHIKERAIPWEWVDLIDRDPARRVRLKIGQERLAKLHPSDIADILEDLAPAEREALFSSLPEETAAETLEEIEPKLQKALLQGLDSERAADILEEMEPEERQDVEELLEFSADTAAGLMTTDYVSALKDGTAADAVRALREFEGDPDTITEIYLLGDHEKLAGIVTLPKLLLASPETKLASLADEHKRSCGLHASDKEVAELFDKYNLRSLPVVDEQGHIAGAIHAEQVIGQLLEA
jgi:CBS domain-containing protein/sporulation protein YlmC with PRC-barrel domain